MTKDIINLVSFSVDFSIKEDINSHRIILEPMDAFCYGMFVHDLPDFFTIEAESYVDLYFCHMEDNTVNQPDSILTFLKLYKDKTLTSIFCKWPMERIQDYCKKISEMMNVNVSVEDFSCDNTIFNKKLHVSFPQGKNYRNKVYLTLNLLRRMFSISQSKSLAIALHMIKEEPDWELNFLTTLILLDSVNRCSHTDELLIIPDGDSSYEEQDNGFNYPTGLIVPTENISLLDKDYPTCYDVTQVFCNCSSRYKYVYDDNIGSFINRYQRYHRPWSNATKNDIDAAKNLLNQIKLL